MNIYVLSSVLGVTETTVNKKLIISALMRLIF